MAKRKEGLLDQSTKRLLIVLILGAIAPILDSTIVAIGMQTLVTRFHSPVATIQWISTGYLLALALAIPFVGWAQARFGGKRLWLFALSLFLVGSVLCAGAWNVESLIAFRIVQGLGGGILFPLIQTLAMQATALSGKNAMGRTMAVVSLPAAVGPILGPVVGGLVLSGLDWPWLFLINLPIGVVALVLAVRFLPPDGRSSASNSRLDWGGAVLLVPALAGLLYGLTNVHFEGGFGRVDVLVPLIGGGLLLIGFVRWAIFRGTAALVDVRLLGKRSVTSASLVLFLLGAPMFAGMFLMPLSWQSLRGFDVLGAALFLIPQGLGSLLARSLAGSLTDKMGSRWVAVLGCFIIAGGTVPFALASEQNLWILEAFLFLRGVGLGTVFIPVMVAPMVDLAKESIAHASMLTRIVQQLGGSFATAATAVVLQAGLAQGSPTSAFGNAFWWVTGVTVLALVASLALPQNKRTT